MNMNKRVQTYTGVKKAFQEFSNTNSDLKFAENRDNLSLVVKLEMNEDILAFYYLYGNTQVTVVENEDVKVITTTPAALLFKMQTITETFIKTQNKKKEK